MPPQIREVEVRLVRLPLREPLVAAHGSITDRPVTLVRVGDGEHDGWGECDALAEPTYDEEFAAGAHLVLRDHLAPRVLGSPAEPAAAAVAMAAVVGHPMAKAALAMAVLDLALRREGRSLAAAWGVERDRVPAGAVAGLASSPAALVERVGRLVAAGYPRVKVKIEPGRDVEPLAAVREAFPEVELQVDANGSYPADAVEPLLRLDELGVTCIEQPFPVGAESAAGDLARRVRAVVALDESVRSPAVVERLLLAGFAGGFVVKPARLGGLVAARAVHDRVAGEGRALVAGGMVEGAVGRAALATLAALPGFTVTGDVSPASRWFTDDVADSAPLTGGDVVLPTGPGLGVVPDEARLAALTVECERIRLRGA